MKKYYIDLINNYSILYRLTFLEAKDKQDFLEFAKNSKLQVYDLDALTKIPDYSFEYDGELKVKIEEK